jgi:long-chain acyl-CoA synthetase
VAPNDESFVVAYLATLWAGLVAVPANWLAPIDEMVREADAVGVTLVVSSPANAELADTLATRLGVVALVVTDDGPEVPPAPCTRDDAAALVFTAGTGGPPKAAILTHGSLAANITQLRARPGLALTATDVTLGALPFFHVFGLNVTLGLALACHAPIVLQPEFHPRAAIEAITAHRITVVAGVPAIYASFLALDDADAPADAFATIRLAVSGGASLAPSIADAMEHRFGVVLEHGYGLTEASPVLTTTVGTSGARDSVGTALPGVEVRVVDVDGEDTVEQDPGEVWARGANVFRGYWGDAATSARVVTADGWLRTGDLGVLNADGSLTLVDRAKDLVIVSGFNVFPAEVEDVLRESADVAEVAVAGIPDDRTGETVVAWVVPVPGRQVDVAALDALAARQLARYKRPTRVEIVDQLPRTFIGKLLRRDLRAMELPPE